MSPSALKKLSCKSECFQGADFARTSTVLEVGRISRIQLPYRRFFCWIRESTPVDGDW